MKNELEAEFDKLMKEGDLHFDCYNYEEAENVIKRAIKLSSKNNLQLKKVEALSYLGYMHAKEIGDKEVVRKSYLECIKILIDIASTERNEIASFYYRLGSTYYTTNAEKLIEYHEEALKLLNPVTFGYIPHARIHKNLGYAYKKTGEIEKAERFYLKALQINREANPERKDDKGWANYIQEISNFYKAIGNELKYQEFKKKYEETIKKVS